MTTYRQTGDIAEHYLRQNNGNKNAAAAAVVMNLMRGDERSFKQGYSIGSALLTAIEMYNLTSREVALVTERVVHNTAEHSSATRRPLVIVNVGGGMVQGTIEKHGLGTPEVYVLDYDKEGCEPDELAEFIDLIERARNYLMDYKDDADKDAVLSMDEAITEYRDMLVFSDDGPAEFKDGRSPSRHR